MKFTRDGDWHHEKHTDGYSVSWKIKNILHRETSEYQELKVVETVQWGRALILDDCVQTTEYEEFIYHEMISHVLMNAHPGVADVLVIGGGDGGVVREVLKYDTVKRVDLVDIDDRVISVCREYLPSIACGLADSRVSIHVMDGVKFVKTADSASYDLVVVDSSDPLGPASVLFSESFYRSLNRILRSDGMMVTQSESPLIYPTVFRDIYLNICKVFEYPSVYLTPIPTYVAGPWAFSVGSKQYDPRTIIDDSRIPLGLKYYNSEIHRAVFAMPEFIKTLIK